MNSQPWRFHVMQGDTRQKAGELVAQATLHLAEYVDHMQSWNREDALEWYSFLGHAPTLIAVSMPKEGSELDHTNNLLSVGASIENLLLGATAEGLAACNVTFPQWVSDELAVLVGLSDMRTVVAAVALGYPGSSEPLAPPHDQDVADWLE
jgi:nitroreductase